MPRTIINSDVNGRNNKQFWTSCEGEGKNASDKTGLQILATYRLKDPPLSRNLNL